MPRYPRSGLPSMRRGGLRTPPVTGRQYGNAPGWTGPSLNTPAPPPPGPATQPIGGQAGAVMTNAARPGAAPLPPRNRFFVPPNKVPNLDFFSRGDESRIRRDRHAYLAQGFLRSGHQPSVPGNPPNPDAQYPPRQTLRLVNVTVNPQIGSDNTRNQDDLTRPYTWFGTQDGSVTRVNGGVPGLWNEYGNRGLPQGIHDPTNGEGGPVTVYAGPPHGLHSATMPDGQQTAARYGSTPQMAPPRLNRPDNSRIAGQSYSQTVLPQGATAAGVASGPSFRAGVSLRAGGRRGMRGA